MKVVNIYTKEKALLSWMSPTERCIRGIICVSINGKLKLQHKSEWLPYEL